MNRNLVTNVCVDTICFQSPCFSLNGKTNNRFTVICLHKTDLLTTLTMEFLILLPHKMLTLSANHLFKPWISSTCNNKMLFRDIWLIHWLANQLKNTTISRWQWINTQPLFYQSLAKNISFKYYIKYVSFEKKTFNADIYECFVSTAQNK